MGNQYGEVIQYPAAFGQGIITVGATTNTDVKADYSSTGNWIDVTAPGGGGFGIYNETEDYMHSTAPVNAYTYYLYPDPDQGIQGTSFSAPVVSGIAALLLSYNPNLYNDDIEQIIRLGVDDKWTLGFDTWYGTGRVNAHKALELLRHPNYFAQISTSGAYSAGNTGVYSTTFFDTPGLAPGVYLVKRYEARKDITLPREFWSTNYVWGRGVSTNGYSAASANFGMGFCDAVVGSITSTTATLYSYVYEVWTLDGDYVGWFPCEPEDVSFAYSVLGEPKLLASTASGVVSAPMAAPYINITWTDPNINEEGYKVERKDATNNEWSEKSSLDFNYISWADTNLVGSETYTYRVKSHNIHQVSEYSNEKVFKARPNAPNDFDALVECIGGTSKVVPSSSVPQSSPPTLYGGGPPGGCQKTNQVFLFWSPPDNQKLDIDYYKVKIVEWGGPTTYEGPIYGLCDTLCLETLTNYNLYVYAVDTEGDEGYYSSVQTITTGHRNMCPDYPNKATVNTNLPEDFFLGQNYPNPFNAQTQIEYGLPEDCNVKLVIYNILGEKVRVLIDEFQSAGIRNIFWDGKNDQGEKVASGIYLYQIQTGTFSKTAKLNFLK